MALDDLDALYKSDAYVRRTCHPLAHAIGHLAYAKYKSVTVAEQYARETCWSGYHHGLMESYISQFDDTQLRARMNGICTQDPAHPYSLAYYNCWHGLGHGLTIRFTQDVFHALRFCNVITHSWERQSCYSGVFMQNIVANGSGMHRAVDLRPSDPIYPVRRGHGAGEAVVLPDADLLRAPGQEVEPAGGVRHLQPRGGALRRHVLPQHGPRHLGRCAARPREIVSQCGMGAAAHRAECIAGAAANAVFDRHARGMADALCRLVDPGDRSGVPEGDRRRRRDVVDALARQPVQRPQTS